MNRVLKLYAPVPVLLVWAVVVEVFGISRAVGAVALLMLAAAVCLQVRESRRDFVEHRDLRRPRPTA